MSGAIRPNKLCHHVEHRDKLPYFNQSSLVCKSYLRLSVSYDHCAVIDIGKFSGPLACLAKLPEEQAVVFESLTYLVL